MKINSAGIFLTVFLLSGCSAEISNSVANTGLGLGNEIIVHAADAPQPDSFVIASHTTEFSTKSGPRANNIILAAKSIDQVIIQPGEIFSYNEAIGPTTKNNGYQKARIFVNGKDEKGYGGGVCQVSSTLYNAALQAGMEITERHPHSKQVKYVEKGKDAATSYGVIDLKFKNNKPYPVTIKSKIMEDKLTVTLEKEIQGLSN